MQVIARASALLLALATASAIDVETLEDQRSATWMIKTNEVVLLGLFEELGSKQEKTFKGACKHFAPDGGVACAVTSNKKLLKKYLGDKKATIKEAPAVVVFNNLDPETGISKKFIKNRAYTADFAGMKLIEFFTVEGLPIVTRLPINLGPDFTKRSRIATSSGLPQFFRFGPDHLGKDHEDTGADGTFMRVAKALKGKATAVGVAVLGGDNDEGTHYMDNMNLSHDDMEEAGALFVMTKGGDKIVYEGAVDDEKALLAWATEFADSHPGFQGKGGKKKRKKKSKKEL